MSYAGAALPPPRIDAKRIAATSGAIAVHIAILMMLLMPPAVKTSDTPEIITDVILDTPKRIPPIPLPPKPPKPEPIHQQLQPVRVPVPEPIVDPVDSTPSPVDVVAPPIPDSPPTTFDGGAASPEFQQLAIANGPPPTYPKMAVARGIEGTVMLRIHVDASGKPMEVSVEHSSGSHILDEAALRFVKAHWSFVPAQSGGQAIDAWGLVPIQYVLQ